MWWGKRVEQEPDKALAFFFSTMVAASLIKWRRNVSNWACRQGERFGQAARSFHHSQYAHPCNMSRI